MIQRKPTHKGFKKRSIQEINERRKTREENRRDNERTGLKRTPTSGTESRKKQKLMSPFGKSTRSKERQSWQSKMLRKHGKGERCEWYEGCYTRDTLTIANAHRLKKVEIRTEREWVDGRAHLCQTHHDFAEHGSHERMWNLVNKCMEFAGRFIPRQKEMKHGEKPD